MKQVSKNRRRKVVDRLMNDNATLEEDRADLRAKSGFPLLWHIDRPPFTETYERWALANRDWPDRKELDDAMALWRKLDKRDTETADSLFAETGRPRRQSELDDWLAAVRRTVNRLLLRYRRARNLALDEWQINVLRVPYREPVGRGDPGWRGDTWMGDVPIDRLWIADPGVFARIFNVNPQQYADLRAYARDVERHYRAWHEIRGGIPEPIPVNYGDEEDPS